MKKTLLWLPLLGLLLFVFIAFLQTTVLYSDSTNKSIDVNTKTLSLQEQSSGALSNVVVIAKGPQFAYSKENYNLNVRVYNLSGEAKDSLKLVLYAPNVLKLQENKDTLYTRFGSINASDSFFYSERTEIDTSNLDGNNKLNKLRKLAIHLKKLEPTSNINIWPYFNFDIVLKLDTIKTTWKLLFQLETFEKENYVRGADAVWEVPIIFRPDFQIQKTCDRLNKKYSCGDSGQFTIKYWANNADAENVKIFDNRPDRLVFTSWNPDTTSFSDLSPNQYCWVDTLLKKGMENSHSIIIKFRNNVLFRKECLNPEDSITASPIYPTNVGELIWGQFRRQMQEKITIEAEPDLIPNLIQMDQIKSLSPGARSNLQIVVKNIGGSEVHNRDFSAVFYWAKLKDQIPTQKTAFNTIRFLTSGANRLEPTILDSLAQNIAWDAPFESGMYRIYVEVDADSEIVELDDLWENGQMAFGDSTYYTNNIDSLDILVGIDSLNVNVTHVSLLDTVTRDIRIIGGFPNHVLSYITVTDQNNQFVLGLADTAKWLRQSDTIPYLNVPVSMIWRPLLEYHRDNPTYPAMNDIYQTSPEFLITEVHDSTRLIQSGDPIIAALVMDYSGSMSFTDIDNAELATSAFVNGMRPQDQSAVIKFGSTVANVQGLTNDKVALKNAIEAASPVSGATAMMDAIYQGIALLSNNPGRKILIVYTDGRDNSSSVGISEAIIYAQRMGVAIYTIGYGPGIQIENLQRIALQTGGEYYSSNDWEEIVKIYSSIAYMVKNYYILAHTTTDPEKNGLWRTVDVTLDYLGNATASDTGQYKPPVQGVDLWVTESSFPDSIVRNESTDQVIAKYALPGDTVSYIISYGNDGYETAANVVLTKFLPDLIKDKINIFPPATMVTDSTLSWNLGNLPTSTVRTITFDLIIPKTMPNFVIPLYDSVFIQGQGERPDQLTNNSAVDTLLVLPRPYQPNVISPPKITAFPQVVFTMEPDTFKILVPSPLKWWDIWIINPQNDTDKTVYSGNIKYFREPLEPLMPDTLVVLPPFFDTVILKDQDTVFYKVCLAYIDWFGQTISVVCDSFMVKANSFRPDLVPLLETLEQDRWRSPNQPIKITSFIKNIGGQIVTANDSFSVCFTYTNKSLGLSGDIKKILLAQPILPNQMDSVALAFEWTPPDTGIYQICMQVDCDSRIYESHDAEPGRYTFNNVDCKPVTIRFGPSEVNITHILLSGEADKGGVSVQASFPDRIISYVTVTDQNHLPIHGLADSSRWLKIGEITNVNVALETVWNPMKEYYRFMENRPASQDLLASLQVTEITAHQRPMLYFARNNLGVVLQQSKNSTDCVNQFHPVARSLVEQLAAFDSALVIKFASSMEISQSLTNNIQALRNGIDSTPDIGTGSALYDGIFEATTQMLAAGGRKIIVVFSAGGNKNSIHTEDETIDFALKNQTPIFIIACTDQEDAALARIARLTGGKYYSYHEWGNLETMAQDLNNRINNFYVFVHSSTDGTANGEWRAVSFALNYANKISKDIGYYLPPIEGRDPWISIYSTPDSVQSLGKLAKPGETFTYTITYGNNGFSVAPSCKIYSFLPDSVNKPSNYSQQPNTINPKFLIWNIGDLQPGLTQAISYDIKVNPVPPLFYLELIDSARITSEAIDDLNLANNFAIDRVYVDIGLWTPPQIKVEPKEVPVNDPVKISISPRSRLEKWELWIEYPHTASRGIDKTEFNKQIINRVEPLEAMPPEQMLIIEPDFQNTKIWQTGQNEKPRETYRAILQFIDQFGIDDTVSTNFTVYAQFDFWPDRNHFNPDFDRLMLTYLLVHDQKISIKIYNVAGEHVQTLVDKPEAAGLHQAYWNGSDKNGRIVGSDVYVIILQAGEYHKLRKVAIVR